MGESELKIALQREGEARIRSFWEAAEATVKSRRLDIEAEIERMRHEAERSMQAELVTLRNSLLFAARSRAMEDRLHAEAAMEERLLASAKAILPELAKKSRSDLWTLLCQELPEMAWAAITVHPEDLEQAKRDFPAAAISTDETLGGGLVAVNAEGTIVVDNSLVCRLLRAWPDLLSTLMADLRKQVDDHDAGRDDKTV